MGFDENYKAKNIKKYVVDHILYFYIIFDTLYLYKKYFNSNN